MILAGGASRRYGSDKAFALWNGKTFLRCVAEAALASCQDLLILGRSDVPIAKYHEIVPEARVRVDIKFQSGPVVALRDALYQLRDDWVLVVPCDAPAITAEDVTMVVDGARASKGPAVAKVGADRLNDFFCMPRARLEERMSKAQKLDDLLADAKEVPLPPRPGLNENQPGESGPSGSL